MVIFVPPDAPTTIFTLFSLSKMIVGHMEDSGLLPATDKHNVATSTLWINVHLLPCSSMVPMLHSIAKTTTLIQHIFIRTGKKPKNSTVINDLTALTLRRMVLDGAV